jgi:hypothetical protein
MRSAQYMLRRAKTRDWSIFFSGIFKKSCFSGDIVLYYKGKVGFILVGMRRGNLSVFIRFEWD